MLRKASYWTIKSIEYAVIGYVFLILVGCAVKLFA